MNNKLPDLIINGSTGAIEYKDTSWAEDEYEDEDEDERVFGKPKEPEESQGFLLFQIFFLCICVPVFLVGLLCYSLFGPGLGMSTTSLLLIYLIMRDNNK